MLLDLEVPDEALRPYLIVGGNDSGPFRPIVKANPARVTAPETEAAIALASLNGIARWRRQQRYRRKLRSWTGLRIVSEGDSWFQYPFLLTDVVDWLSEPYAIYSLDAAGDLLSDMVQQGELVTAVVQEKPHVVLLSGGGNDLLGGSHLSQAVLAFEAGRPARNYLGQSFKLNLDAALANYKQLFSRLAEVAPRTPILCHVYDYAAPARGRWLGQPLATVGIADPALQREIVRAIVDRFHAELTALASGFPQVRVIDTRGAVGDTRWHDELHPNDAGFAAVAGLFAAEIARATATDVPKLATEASVEGAAIGATDEVERLLDRLAIFPDDALLHEIGRREVLARAGNLQHDPVTVFPSSVAGTFPEFRDEGLRVATEAVAASGARGAASSTVLAHRLSPVLVSRGAREDQAMLIAAWFLRRSPAEVEALRRHATAPPEPSL
ncbi:SGNH/GDSL hydrolase family protein [Methylorubrum aminovorans]